MRINVEFTKTKTKITTYEQLRDAIKTKIKSGDLDSVKVKLQDGLDAGDVAKRLQRLKGVVRASYGTVGHYPGLGGTYGTGITVYVDAACLPTIQWDDDGRYCVNTMHILQQLEDNRLTKLEQLEDEDVDTYFERKGLVQLSADNSYNYSSDLRQDINLEFYGPKGGEAQYMVIRVHHGGDARCNYGDERVYAYDNDDHCFLLDSIHSGFHFISEGDEDNDRYTTAYTSEPQYKFFEDHDFVSRDGDVITVKSKATGEFKRAVPDAAVLYR